MCLNTKQMRNTLWCLSFPVQIDVWMELIVDRTSSMYQNVEFKATARHFFFPCRSFWINSASYGYKNSPLTIIYQLTYEIKHMIKTWLDVWLFMCRYSGKQERIQLFLQAYMGGFKRLGVWRPPFKAPGGCVAKP
jgi:hypothetical protein